MFDFKSDDFLINSDKALLQTDKIVELLNKTYWADSRPAEIIQKSIDNSVCFGVYFKGNQIGFARVVTDYATMYYLCDVVIDEEYRGKGLGKRLIRAITDDERFKNLSGLLGTKDAHGLYEKYGFVRNPDSSMVKRNKSNIQQNIKNI